MIDDTPICLEIITSYCDPSTKELFTLMCKMIIIHLYDCYIIVMSYSVSVGRLYVSYNHISCHLPTFKNKKKIYLISARKC